MTTPTAIATCVRSVSRPFATKYGSRVKAEFQIGCEAPFAIFADEDEPAFQQLRKGCIVELLQSRKGWQVGRVGEAVQVSAVARTATGGAPLFKPASPPAASPERRISDATELAERIRRHASTLAFCLREVQKLPDFQNLNEDGQRQMAVTVFIQSNR